MKKITPIIILSILLFSCRSKEERSRDNAKVEVIQINNEDILVSKKLSSFIEIDSLVNLEYCQQSKIGEIEKVIVTNDRIYIFDRRIAKALFCFDDRGNFINNYKDIGKGSRQYLRIDDISVYNNIVYVSAYPNKLFKLNKNLDYLKSIKVKWGKEGYRGQHMLAINEDTLLFSDTEAKTKFNFYSIKNKKFIGHHSFAVGKDNTLANEPVRKNSDKLITGTLDFQDTVFTLTPSTMKPYKIINFEYPITTEEKLELRKLDFMDRSEPKDKMYNISNYWENEEFITMIFIYKERNHFYMYDKVSQSAKIFGNDVPNDVFGSKYFPRIKGYYKNSMIISAEPIDLLSNINNIDIPQGLDSNSNPVLIFYHPKFN